MKKPKWFFHKEHGYLVRYPQEHDMDLVVSALVLGTAEIQKSSMHWDRHVNRLHVNFGCGAICVDEMLPEDHNPEFERVRVKEVPRHIVEAFALHKPEVT